MSYKCSCCGSSGRLTQGPWPIPVSWVYCSTCYELEGIAYSVWRRLNPDKLKTEAPIPFMKSLEDYPPDVLCMSYKEIEEHFRQVLDRRPIG